MGTRHLASKILHDAARRLELLQKCIICRNILITRYEAFGISGVLLERREAKGLRYIRNISEVLVVPLQPYLTLEFSPRCRDDIDIENLDAEAKFKLDDAISRSVLRDPMLHVLSEAKQRLNRRTGSLPYHYLVALVMSGTGSSTEISDLVARLRLLPSSFPWQVYVKETLESATSAGEFSAALFLENVKAAHAIAVQNVCPELLSIRSTVG